MARTTHMAITTNNGSLSIHSFAGRQSNRRMTENIKAHRLSKAVHPNHRKDRCGCQPSEYNESAETVNPNIASNPSNVAATSEARDTDQVNDTKIFSNAD